MTQQTDAKSQNTSTTWSLAIIITIIALADALLHLLLDYILFKGQLWGKLTFAPPPGKLRSGMNHSMSHAAPSHMFHSNPILSAFDISKITGLPLNELFLLNAIGYIVLLVIFWSWPRNLRTWRWIIDLILIGYSVASIISWINIGMPNPHNLGYLSKVLEVALILVVIAHSWLLLKKKPFKDDNS